MTEIHLNQFIEHRDERGRLILKESERETQRHSFYHKKRHYWCNKYRKAWSPKGFREGRFNLINLLFLITRF